MRQVLRAALRETDGTVAVVCGAWHAPALAGPLPPAARDAALLRGMPRRKAALAWVPWTHSRLAAASGYGAGITSPGWYHHLFTAPDKTIERWMTRVAGVLRDHDLPVSSAHVIEAVRLAQTLATLRGRPLAGLAEVSEATKAVMCDGDDVAAAFVTRDLVVGRAARQRPRRRAAGSARRGPARPGEVAEAADRAAGQDARAGPAHRDWTGPVGVPASADRARHRLGRRHRGPGQGDRHLPRDMDAALAARARRRHHRRRRLGHDGPGRRDRRDHRRGGERGRLAAVTAAVELVLVAGLPERPRPGAARARRPRPPPTPTSLT